MLLLGFVKSGFMHLESTEDDAAPAETLCGSGGVDTVKALRATGGLWDTGGPLHSQGIPALLGWCLWAAALRLFPVSRQVLLLLPSLLDKWI